MQEHCCVVSNTKKKTEKKRSLYNNNNKIKRPETQHKTTHMRVIFSKEGLNFAKFFFFFAQIIIIIFYYIGNMYTYMVINNNIKHNKNVTFV